LAKIISVRDTHVGNTWFGVYLKGKRYITTKKKFPSKKLPNTEKMGYPVLNSITAKNGKFYNSITKKMTFIIGKRTKNRI
jgi:hypothetical protein